jgi:hypothetical protein
MASLNSRPSRLDQGQVIERAWCSTRSYQCSSWNYPDSHRTLGTLFRMVFTGMALLSVNTLEHSRGTSKRAVAVLHLQRYTRTVRSSLGTRLLGHHSPHAISALCYCRLRLLTLAEKASTPL